MLSVDEMAEDPKVYRDTLGVSGGGGLEELVRTDQAPASAGTGPLGAPDP